MALYDDEEPTFHFDDDVCRRFHGGDSASSDAWRRMQGKPMQLVCAKVWRALLQRPRTCDEVEQLTGLKHQTASACMALMRKANIIYRTGVKRQTRSKTKAKAHECAVSPAYRPPDHTYGPDGPDDPMPVAGT